MRKFIWISSLILMPLGAVAGVIAYSWQQATSLPDWYQAQDASSTQSLSKVAIAPEPQPFPQQATQSNPGKPPVSLPGSANAATPPTAPPAPSVITPDNAGANDPVTLVFDRAEAEAWLQAKATRHLAQSKVAPAILGFQVSLENDRLRGGAVVRLADLPLEQLDPKEKRLVQQAMDLFPVLRRRQFYIGIEGQPMVKAGRLRFDDNAQVRLGNLQMPLREAAARLGVSQSDLESRFSVKLLNDQMEVDRITIEGDRVLIQGRKR